MKTYLEPEDIELIEGAATCLRDRLLIRILFRLGCRVSEALAFKVSDILLATPYNVPLGNWPVVKYIRGQLLGDSDSLAAKTNEYPIMSWRSTIKSVEFSESGEYVVKFEETLTPRLGNGISFQRKSFEVWQP